MSISTSFRPLNEHELAAIKSYNDKGKIQDDHLLARYSDSVQISYEKMQGGFCVCVLIVDCVVPDDNFPLGTSESGIKTTRHIYRGASRRSYKDPRKPIRGEMLAFSRAILYSRPVELS